MSDKILIYDSGLIKKHNPNIFNYQNQLKENPNSRVCVCLEGVPQAFFSFKDLDMAHWTERQGWTNGDKTTKPGQGEVTLSFSNPVANIMIQTETTEEIRAIFEQLRIFQGFMPKSDSPFKTQKTLEEMCFVDIRNLQ